MGGRVECAILARPTEPGAALDPVPLADEVTWVLPVRVLNDPAHAQHHDYLSALPQRDVDPSEFPQPEDD